MWWLVQLSLLLFTILPSLVAQYTEANRPQHTPPTTVPDQQLYVELFLIFTISALTVQYLLPIPKKQIKSLQSCVSSLATFATYTYRRPHYVLTTLLNPLQFQSSTLWFCLLVLKILALSLLDQIVLKAVRQCLHPKPLGFRTRHPNVKGLVHLQWIDFLYLSINQVIEYVFMLNVIQFSLQHTHVYWSVSDVSPLNTVLGLYLLFVVDDLLYAPSHYFMHWKYIYPYIHKHHHRQILPKRG